MITINLATIKLCRSSWRNSVESLIKPNLFERQLIIWESQARKQFLISIPQRRVLIASTRVLSLKSSFFFIDRETLTTNDINFDIFLITDIFDVYNIETALPVIDLEAIETHLMAAKEEEQMVSYQFVHFFTYKWASIKKSS